MSYEGHEQYLCQAGHTWEMDCWETMDLSPRDEKRPKCGASVAWWNSVDETNGSHVTITPGEAVDDLARAHLWNKSELAILHEIVESGEPREIRIDGFVDLEIDKPAEFCECPTCKNKHCVEEPMYKVPEKLGHRIGEING